MMMRASVNAFNEQKELIEPAAEVFARIFERQEIGRCLQ